MLKLSLFVSFVSIAFICIMKENTAAVQESNDQSENSDTTNIQEDSNHPNQTNHPRLELKNEPFEVVKREIGLSQTSPIYKLPSEMLEIEGNWRLASGPLHTITTSLCPEILVKTDDTETEEFIEKILDIFPNFSSCLFEKNFDENETQTCEAEPKLVIENMKQDDGSAVICGLNDYQLLIEAQYYNCGSDDDLDDYANKIVQAYTEGTRIAPPFEPRRYVMYQICYDFEHKRTLWTKHTPMTPALLSHPKSPTHKLSNEIHLADFSTDISFLELTSSTFSSLKKSYKSTDPNSNMIYTLVPKNHMALLYWKKATDHMINSAPLLPEFIPLMEAINNKILQESENLYAKSRKTLQIYTRAETKVLTTLDFITSLPFVTSAMSLIMPKTPINLFESNIWLKLIYDESEKSAILIVLHNTREELPKDKECDDDELLPCDFKSWSNSPGSIPDDTLSHAYCCGLSEERIQYLFSMKELQIEKYFDLQKTGNFELAAPLKQIMR